MKITDQVKIGGETYKVTRVSVCDEDNRNIDGQIVYSKNTIKIQDNLSGDYLNYVFIHEIFHGIYEHCGFEQNENEVNRLARALHMVIKDNPEIFREVE